MKRLVYTLILFCCVDVEHGIAGGFKVALQGQKQSGMAGTGIGLAQDGATMYYNPGGLSFVNNQINIGVNGLFPSISFLSSGTNTLVQANNHMYTPFSAYLHTSFRKKWKVGIACYTPFGTGVTYPNDWEGRYILRKVNLQTIFVQPTVAFQLNNKLALGVGYILATGNMLLNKDLPIQSVTGSIANAELRGNAAGMGYSVGIYAKANEKLNAGITFRSGVIMKVNKGKAVFSNIPLGLQSQFPSSNTFTTSLHLPAELGFGFSYRLRNDLVITFDCSRTFWHSYDSLGFDYAINSSSLTDTPSPRLYKDASCVRVGAQYQANKKLDVRAGFFYDRSPVQDGYVSPELPDNHKTGITLGATCKIDERTHIDLSLLYEELAPREEKNVESGLTGTYQSKVLAPGIGITYLMQKRTQKRKHY